MHNRDIIKAAKLIYHADLGISIAAFIVYWVIMNVAVGTLGIAIIIGGPLTLGLYMFLIQMVRKQKPEIAVLFEGFKSFVNSLIAFILISVFVFLWSILLIIPGIIAALRYSMTFFILAENPQMDALEAMKKSKEMMVGQKWKLFCMYFRFFFWWLLCIITLGLAFIYVGPYMAVATARFYEDIKGEPASG